ncbi:NUDIX domain-containing protein [Sutcliffiella rhizosphaerae]|uniref:RNA pyrophosphohydrolase n=1 Tax=Sutcliffiella rhizosphaerae TaxID=2880967 RepID=A0ABM8YR22_9BACI|nr:NUDIX domain-containing protein [Sutcliffiella rhizosphaerae]CAG9622465.1 RNA pyrophosphohydrolase [Sutcliffiella rhizosphaerae]
MAISAYYQQLRNKIGKDLLLIPSVAAIIRNGKNEILLQLPANETCWSLPAGAIEPGESPEEAIIREVWEEAGLRVKVEKLVGVFGGKGFRYIYHNGDQVEYVVSVFDCSVLHGDLIPIDGESKILKYVDYSHFPPLALPFPTDIFQKEK